MMAITAFYLDEGGNFSTGLSREEIQGAFESKTGFLWVDVEETSEADVEFLREVFGFHPLALETCLDRDVPPPKIEDFGDYLFVIVQGIDYTSESEFVETTELDLFVGSHFLVSNHPIPLMAVGSIRSEVERDGRLMESGPDFLAYTLIDLLVSNVLPTIDRMGEVADAIEEEAVTNPQQSSLQAILQLKRSSLRIHRVIVPQREVVNRLGRREFPLIRQETEVFFRHAYDRVVRVEDLNKAIGDRADNAQATYLAAVSIRQNETMKSLAIVASIFLPLSLVAGIYGMNFENMPELEWKWGYYAILFSMLVIVAGTMAWFWARNWITWGRREVVSRARLFAVAPEKLATPVVAMARRWRQHI